MLAVCYRFLGGGTRMSKESLDHCQKLGESDGWALRTPKEHFLSPDDNEAYTEAYNKTYRQREERDELAFDRCPWAEQEG